MVCPLPVCLPICPLQEGAFDPSGNYLQWEREEEGDAWLDSIQGGCAAPAPLAVPRRCLFKRRWPVAPWVPSASGSLAGAGGGLGGPEQQR